MFLKETVFKRLAKEAYKGDGLYMARLKNEALMIGGEWWNIQINDEAITNKMKAAIIELTGDIPDKGNWIYREKVITAEFAPGEIAKTLEATYSESRVPVEDTKLIREDKGYLKRAFITEDGSVYCVFEETMDLITTKNLQSGEAMPEKPTVVKHEEKSYMTWENNYCRLTVTCQTLSPELEKAARGLCS